MKMWTILGSVGGIGVLFTLISFFVSLGGAENQIQVNKKELVSQQLECYKYKEMHKGEHSEMMVLLMDIKDGVTTNKTDLKWIKANLK